MVMILENSLLVCYKYFLKDSISEDIGEIGELTRDNGEYARIRELPWLEQTSKDLCGMIMYNNNERIKKLRWWIEDARNKLKILSD